jgi:DNA-directed RNA polymerase subunit RPC12/RpoP
MKTLTGAVDDQSNNTPCTACGYVSYCSEQCQAMAKKEDIHSELEVWALESIQSFLPTFLDSRFTQCKLLQSYVSSGKPSDVSAEDWDFARLAIRALAVTASLKSQPNAGIAAADVTSPSSSSSLSCLQPSDFDLLCSNLSYVPESVRRNYQRCAERLHRVVVDSEVAKDFDYSVPRLVEVMSKISCNNFGWWVNYEHCPASGVFVQASFFNHSCLPNCKSTYDGRELVVRALYAVKANSPLCIGYVDIFLPAARRIEQLRREYFFDCCCSRCVPPDTPALDSFIAQYRCSQCSGTLVPIDINADQYRCPMCKFERQLSIEKLL